MAKIKGLKTTRKKRENAAKMVWKGFLPPPANFVQTYPPPKPKAK